MNTSVHRLLDEAFAGLPATPDVQDLKEEIRANLLDRVGELTADGVAPDDAARRAFAWVAVDGLALAGGVVLLSYLAATTTNRKKQWVVAEAAGSRAGAELPASAAATAVGPGTSPARLP